MASQGDLENVAAGEEHSARSRVVACVQGKGGGERPAGSSPERGGAAGGRVSKAPTNRAQAKTKRAPPVKSGKGGANEGWANENPRKETAEGNPTRGATKDKEVAIGKRLRYGIPPLEIPPPPFFGMPSLGVSTLSEISLPW